MAVSERQYVNVYFVERVEIANDEWYESGKLVSSTDYSAEAYARATQEAIQENISHPLSSMVQRGVYVVRVENFPGEDFPRKQET